MNRILVCPVAFNENVKLRNVIDRYLESCAKDQTDYLVVDDASDDGTTEIIESFASYGVRTIKHQRRQGVGSAIRTAIKHAKHQGYDVLVIMAGNDKDSPDEILELTDLILKKGYDFVQGSRYKNSGGIGGNMPRYRKVATRVHSWLLSLMTGQKITDSTNGFRAFRLSMFDDQRINIDQAWLDHYELEPYLLYKAVTLGFKFTEAPVTKIYPPKDIGYTKMRPIIGWWSILRPLVYLGLKIKK